MAVMAGTETAPVLLVILSGVVMSLIGCVYGSVLARITRLEKKVNAVLRAMVFLVSNYPAAAQGQENPSRNHAMQALKALTDALK